MAFQFTELDCGKPGKNEKWLRNAESKIFADYQCALGKLNGRYWIGNDQWSISGTFQDGKRHGTEIEVQERTQILDAQRVERNFENGIPHGRVRASNRALLLQYNLEKGRRQGEARSFGAAPTRQEFVSGKLASSKDPSRTCEMETPEQFATVSLGFQGKCPFGENANHFVWGEDERGVPVLEKILSCTNGSVTGLVQALTKEGMVWAEGNLVDGIPSGNFVFFSLGKKSFSAQVAKGKTAKRGINHGLPNALATVQSQNSVKNSQEIDATFECLCAQGYGAACEMSVASALYQGSDQVALARLIQTASSDPKEKQQLFAKVFAILDIDSTESVLMKACKEKSKLCVLKSAWRKFFLSWYSRHDRHAAIASFFAV